MKREKIIVGNAALRKVVRVFRGAGKTIVFSNGCYDLFHVGHLRSLKDARARGDALIVGVNSDRSARNHKGPGHPIVPERERVEILAGLDCVDFVTLFDDSTVDRLLEWIRPDVYAKGTEYTLRTLPERDTLKRLKIRFARVGDPKDHSTTRLIERVVALHGGATRLGKGPRRGATSPR